MSLNIERQLYKYVLQIYELRLTEYFSVLLYGPTFGNAESSLSLFAAQCFNTESMQKVFLCHSCM
jgi:hypothetical protein